MGEPGTRREFARAEVLSTVVPYVLRSFLQSSILSIAETVLKGRGQQPLLKSRGAPLRDNGRHEHYRGNRRNQRRSTRIQSHRFEIKIWRRKVLHYSVYKSHESCVSV